MSKLNIISRRCDYLICQEHGNRYLIRSNYTYSLFIGGSFKESYKLWLMGEWKFDGSLWFREIYSDRTYTSQKINHFDADSYNTHLLRYTRWCHHSETSQKSWDNMVGNWIVERELLYRDE